MGGIGIYGLRPGTTGGGGGADTEYDHLIRNRGDLAAVTLPVLGVFTLPAGSYFLKADVTLDPGESIQVVGNVIFAGGGPEYALGGNAAGVPTITVTSTGKLTLMNLTIEPPNGVPGVEVKGELDAQNSIISTDGARGVLISDGAAIARFNGGEVNVTGAADGVEQQDGELNATNWRVRVDTQAAMRVDNGAVGASPEQFLANVLLETTAATEAVVIDQDDSDMHWTNVKVQSPIADANRGLVLIDSNDGCSTFQMNGGWLNGTSGGTKSDGIRIDGDIDGAILLSGVSGLNLEAMIEKEDDNIDVDRVVVSGCEMGASEHFVKWFNNLPDSMAIIGNVGNMDASDFVQGFNENSNDVNMKGNIGTDQLVSETPIVP